MRFTDGERPGVKRGGTTGEKRNDGEVEYHSHDQIAEERDRPRVSEEYD